MPGVSLAGRGWRRERRALRSGGGAGGVTGRPRDPRGSTSSCPAQIPREPGPRPRAQSSLLARPGGCRGAGGRGSLGARSPERIAQQARRGSGRMQARSWRAVEGGPGPGRGGRAGAGRVRGAGGGHWEDDGAGDAEGRGPPWDARWRLAAHVSSWPLWKPSPQIR